MEKFFNLMYDFFAFALPGACIIISLLFLGNNEKLVFYHLQFLFAGNYSYLFLGLALLGYIVGYVVKPIARYLLLINLSVFLFGYFFPLFRYPLYNKKQLKNRRDKYDKLAKVLMKNSKSKVFIRVRELMPKSAQYIEFWDMHITMAHNLAFACIVFFIIQIINLCCNSAILDEENMVILFLALVLVFLTLLRISVKFSFWWRNDLKAALKFIKKNKLAKKVAIQVTI